MSKREDAFWAKVQADFCAGMPLTRLAEKHQVSVAAILQRSKREGWRRIKVGAKAHAEHKKSAALVVIETISTEERVDAVHEAIAEQLKEIVEEHRKITRGLRDLFEDTVAEYRAMLSYLSSFLNQEAIDQFIEKNDRVGLEKYLRGAMAVFDMRTGTLDKLVRIGATLVEGERKVWGLDALDSAPEEANWDTLLEKLADPVHVPALPDHVINFDEKLKAAKQRK